MLHVYGIIDGPSLGAGMARGHGGRAVSVLAAGDVAAVVSPAGPAAVEPTPDNVWHHERLLGTLMARHAVLPMRFATTCDGDALVRQLQARRQALRDGLRRVAGFVDAVDSLAVGCPDLAVTCTGPWAPYSFVGDLTAPEEGTDGRA